MAWADKAIVVAVLDGTAFMCASLVQGDIAVHINQRDDNGLSIDREEGRAIELFKLWVFEQRHRQPVRARLSAGTWLGLCRVCGVLRIQRRRGVSWSGAPARTGSQQGEGHAAEELATAGLHFLTIHEPGSKV